MFEQQAILIVEDEPFIALDLALAVEANGGLVVGPAARVCDALALIATIPIHAAIIDGTLFDGEATPVAAALRKCGIPFVLFSAIGPYHELVSAFPDVSVMTKPAAVATVVAKLEQVISERA